MNQYVTGRLIKELRERNNLTQVELADILGVTDKAVSKWETGKGYPDISLIEPLSKTLKTSITELLSGESIENINKNSNMLKLKFYVCPICGNIIVSVGESLVTCCGLTLPPLEINEVDDAHSPIIENVEDEYYISFNHTMTKSHYISFICGVTFDSYELIKLYPEGDASARLKRGKTKYIYYYCNLHGLYRKLVK